MNSERRGEIEKIIAGLEWTGEDLRQHPSEYPAWGKMFASLTAQLENVRDEELESLQSMPSGIQKGSRGELVTERLKYLNISLATAEALEAESVAGDQIPTLVGNITRALENAMA